MIAYDTFGTLIAPQRFSPDARTVRANEFGTHPALVFRNQRLRWEDDENCYPSHYTIEIIGCGGMSDDDILDVAARHLFCFSGYTDLGRSNNVAVLAYCA